jgi:hypothetical protein
MIKGIIALFTSGAMFNPMVILGILGGFAAMGFLDSDQLYALYTNPTLYLCMILVAGAYVVCCRRVYYRGGVDVDWGQTALSVVGHFLRLVVSFIFSMLFVYSISFGGDDLEQTPELPEFDQIEQQVRQQQQDLQKNYEEIMKNY